jgi:hypothetical protein
MVVLFIPYFVLTPLLDYDVQEDGTSQLNSQLNIKITNYGIAIAKHVMLSMNGDRNSVTSFYN